MMGRKSGQIGMQIVDIEMMIPENHSVDFPQQIVEGTSPFASFFQSKASSYRQYKSRGEIARAHVRFYLNIPLDDP